MSNDVMATLIALSGLKKESVEQELKVLFESIGIDWKNAEEDDIREGLQAYLMNVIEHVSDVSIEHVH